MSWRASTDVFGCNFSSNKALIQVQVPGHPAVDCVSILPFFNPSRPARRARTANATMRLAGTATAPALKAEAGNRSRNRVQQEQGA